MKLPTFVLVIAAACAAPKTGPAGAPDGRGSAATADAPPAADAAVIADGAVTVAPPDADGPYAVLVQDVSAVKTTLTVYAPSTDGGAHVAAGAFALVVVSPGFQMPRSEYAAYAHRLASHGFVAIAQDFTGGFSPDHLAYAQQTSAVIDWAKAGGGGLLAGHVGDAIGVAGHSMGGKVSVLAATLDARIGAVVGWDPVDSGDPSVAPERMGDLHAALVVLGETTDASGGFMPCAPAADDYAQYYAAARAPAISITVNGADHMDFVDDPSCTLCGLCTAGTADATAVHALASRTTVAAFRRYLRGEGAMDAYLTGAVIQADAAAGAVAVESK